MAKRKQRLHRRDMADIEKFAAAGLSRKAIAARLRMLAADFRQELRRLPQAQLRLEAGEARHETNLYGQLLSVAAKQSGSPGSVTPLLFALKTRFGYDDRPKPEPASPVSVNIALPPPMSPDDYARLAARVNREQIEGEVADDE